MTFATADALLWCERLLGLAIALQAVELFQLRDTMSANGVWQWRTIRRDLAPFPPPIRRLFDLLLDYPNVLALLALQLAAAAALVFLQAADRHWLPLLVVFASTVLLAVRFRGTFNGGSDYMTTLVALMLLVARMFEHRPSVTAACLYYIALQTCLSYFVAGLVKIRNAEWRAGTVLPRFLQAPSYVPPAAVQNALRSRPAALAASWGVMLFECGFPAALLGPLQAAALIGCALLFHLANVYALGLNRFFFAWIAAYPAVYWASWRMLTPGSLQ